MSKAPSNWQKDLGDRAQKVWDFAEATCKANRERKLRRAQGSRCNDCDTDAPCDKCYRGETDRIFHGYRKPLTERE